VTLCSAVFCIELLLYNTTQQTQSVISII